MGIGDYPVEYNPKVHGPYDPARFYGTPDTPFSQVKLGEVTLILYKMSGQTDLTRVIRLAPVYYFIYVRCRRAATVAFTKNWHGCQ